MSEEDKQFSNRVFISYRRTHKFNARIVEQRLKEKGYNVFYDQDSLGPGKFAEQILNNIPARRHFVLVLVPGDLDRCSNPQDWVRREIETAIEEKRHIVTALFEDFDFGDVKWVDESLDEEQKAELTTLLSKIKNSNSIVFNKDHYDESIENMAELLDSDKELREERILGIDASALKEEILLFFEEKDYAKVHLIELRLREARPKATKLMKWQNVENINSKIDNGHPILILITQTLLSNIEKGVGHLRRYIDRAKLKDKFVIQVIYADEFPKDFSSSGLDVYQTIRYDDSYQDAFYEKLFTYLGISYRPPTARVAQAHQHYSDGLIAWQRNEFEQAISALTRALSVYEKHPDEDYPIPRNDILYRRAEIYRDYAKNGGGDEKYHEALKDLKIVLEENNNE